MIQLQYGIIKAFITTPLIGYNAQYLRLSIISGYEPAKSGFGGAPFQQRAADALSFCG
jgi:hypothetical protein